MTSNEPVKPKKKNKLKGGAKNESNEKYLIEYLRNKNLYMDLAMQIISKYQIVRSDTVQDLKDFNCQSLATKAKKKRTISSMLPAIKKTFDLLGDDIVELSTKNDALKL